MDKEKDIDDFDIKNNTNSKDLVQDILLSNLNLNLNENSKAINQTYDEIKSKSPNKSKNSQFDNEDQALFDQLSLPRKPTYDIQMIKKESESDSNNQEKKLKDEIAQLFESINAQRHLGNKAFHNNQMAQAEIDYTKAIDYLNNYTIENTIKPNSQLNINFQKEKKKVLKILKENLSMSQAKLGKFYQAICTANDIIKNYDSLSESTHRHLLSWYIKINEIEKAKMLAEEIRGKFSDQSVFIPYFDNLAKKKVTDLNLLNSKKNTVDYTSWIIGTIGIVSAAIALLLICTKKD